MTKVPAWSFSSLDTFATCARKYHAERILKSVQQEETEAQRVGTWAHKCFEDRLGLGKVPLPPSLEIHEMFMREIEAIPGTILVERKVGLNRKLEPCDFFAKDVWWRGVIDVEIRKADGSITIIDYKTGRPHTKMRQLHLFMVYGFLSSQAATAEAMFYWTKTQDRTRIKMPRTQLGPILMSVTPDLEAYKEAFKLDIWPPKPNGLCQNYCGVVECEFAGRKMGGRYR